MSGLIRVILLFSIEIPLINIIKQTFLALATIQKIIKKCREVILNYVETNQHILGNTYVFEIYETIFSRWKYNGGRVIQ